MRRQRSAIGNFIEVTLIILYILAMLSFGGYIFTRDDTPGGSNNVNVSNGSLKVDIIDSAEHFSLVGDVLDFAVPDENRNIYFEPGATYITQPFAIKNEGTLAIDYFITISEGDADPKTVEEFKKAFVFWITTDPSGKSGETLLSYRGALEPGSYSEDLYIVVAMREDAGNEFQGKSYEGIGITVNAVELNRK